MKATNSLRHLLRAGTLALALFTLAQPAAQAANQIWLGNINGFWNTSANWSAGPLAAGDTLTFGAAGTSGVILTNDTTAATSFGGITFNALASPFTIGGNSIMLAGNIAGNNASPEFLNFNIALGATPTISGNATVITLGGVVSGTGFGLTRTGNSSSILTLSGLNTYNGVVTLSAGTLVAKILDVGGNPSSIGQSSSAAANLLLANGTTFKYAGPAVTTDRSFTLNGTAAGNGASLDASGSGSINWNNPATPAYGTANQTRNLTLTGSNPGNNTLASLIADNGSGATSLTKSGVGTWVLSGANTYSGPTTNSQTGIPSNGSAIVQFGTLVATLLANGGSPSSLGQSGNSAANLQLGNGTVLKYTGGAASTDRAFTLNSDANNSESATLDASGTGAINWTSTSPVAFSTANFTRTLILSGSSTAYNTLSLLLQNNGTAALSLAKGGQGTWALNGPVVNTYTGSTTVNGGTLVEDFSNLTSGYANLISTSSPFTLGGGTLSLKGNSANASSQTFTNAIFSSQAGSGIALTGNGGNPMTLTLPNAWTRNAGSTLNLTLGPGGTLSSSPTNDTSLPTPLVEGSGNIAFVTVGGTDWAKVSGGTVVGFAGTDYTAGLPASGATTNMNYSQTDGATVTTSESVNTLKLSTSQAGQSLAITAGQTLTLNAGGLLFVGTNDYSITGGTLSGSGGTQKDLVVHQFGTGNLTIGSTVASSTVLTKTGPGTLTLTGANPFTGATYLGGGGTVDLQNQFALSNSVVNINNSSVVFDSSVAANAFAFGGLAAPYGGPGYDLALTNNAGAPIALTVGNNNGGGTYYGTLSGPGSLIKVGTGTLTLSGLNTYTGGTIVSNGTLNCGLAFDEWFLGGGGPNGNVQVTVYSGGTLGLQRGAINGTLNLNGGTVTSGNGFGGTWAGPVILGAGTTNTLNITGGLTLSGVISGTGALTKTGAAGVTLSGVNTYSGNTTISTGTLTLTAGGSIYNTPNLTLATGAALDVSGVYTNVALRSGQTLKVSAMGTNAPGKITLASNKGLILSPGGLVFTAYAGGTNALTVAGTAGSLALNAAPVTVTTTTALGAGAYPLIAPTNSANATVAGTPGPLTVNGSGLGGGNSAWLAVSNGALVMTVDTTPPTQLAVSVPASAYVGLPFSVTVTAQDANGTNRTGTSATTITLSVATGSGSLSGTLTGIIPAGSTSVTFTGLAYGAADTMTLTASATSGMSLTAVTSSGINFSVPPTQLAITSVNGGSSPIATIPFSVVVQAQDGTGTPRGVIANTAVSLSLNTGTGTVGGTLSGTILAGQNSVTFSGVTYSQPEAGVVLTATRTSGDTLTAGNSAPFTVVPSSAKNILTFTFPVLGAATISGTNISIAAPTGTSVTSLAPTYTVSAFASGSPASGTALDFTTPQTYVITAQDGSQQAYAVTVNLFSVFAWTNSASGNWSDAGNWTNNFGWVGAPLAAGEADYVLNFNQAGTYTATSDLNNGFLLNQLNFGAASGALTLAGSDLAFTNNGANLPQITQNSSVACMITNSLTLATNTTYGGSGSGQVTLAALVSGAGGLIMNSTGTLQLYGITPNPYSGGTIVNSGTLHLGAFIGGVSLDCVDPAGAGTVTLNGGTIEFERVTASEPLIANGGTLWSQNGWGATWSGPITLNSNLTCNEGWPLTCSGPISGAGGLIKTGTATLTLSAANSYTGPTLVNSGTLVCANINSLGNGGTLSIASGATNNLNYTGSHVVSALTLGGVPQTIPGTYGSSGSGAANPSSYFLGTGTVTVPGPAQFITFNVPGASSVSIDDIGLTIAVTMPPRSDVTHLAPTYTLTSGTCVPTSGSTQNFSSPVIYTVTDGATIHAFTVTVAVTPSYFWQGPNGGNWSTAANWNNTVPGAGNVAVFSDSASAGATVNLDTDETVAGLEFNNLVANQTIESTGSNTLTLGATNGITVDAGTHTISAPLTSPFNINVHGDASATLNLSGNVTSGPSKNYDDELTSGPNVVLNGAAHWTASGNYFTIGCANGGTLTINSGTTFDCSASWSLYLAWHAGDKGKVIQNGGMVRTPAVGTAWFNNNGPGVQLGGGASGNVTAEYDLNGGTLITPNVYNTYDAGGTALVAPPAGSAVFRFNGGVLQGTQNDNLGDPDVVSEGSTNLIGNLSHAYVGVGGANIDVATFGCGINQALEHDPALGSTPDGGLHAMSTGGPGTLALYQLSTFTGPLAIDTGVTVGLAYTGNQNIASLTVGGAVQPAGVYGVGHLNPGGVFTGTGTVTIVAPTLVWTGQQSGEWSTNVIGGAKNWTSEGNPTDYANGVFVQFAGLPGTSTVDLSVADVTPASVSFDTSSTNFTVQGSQAIAGATGLTLGGTGMLTILNNNSFTGGTIINAGTLQLGDGTSGHDGTIAGSGAVVNNGALVYNRYGTTTYGGMISGSGPLTKTGPGTQMLTNANTFTGNATVSNGMLYVSTAMIGNRPNVAVNDGAGLGVLNLVANQSAEIGSLTLGNSSGSSTLAFSKVADPNTPVLIAYGGVTLNGSCTIRIGDKVNLVAGNLYPLFWTTALTTNSGPGFSLSLPAGVEGDLVSLSGGVRGIALNVTAISAINTNPPPLHPVILNGTQFSLSWPTNAGWILQAQTNSSLAQGLSGNNWVDVPGSDAVTGVTNTINPANASVFYRLRLP